MGIIVTLHLLKTSIYYLQQPQNEYIGGVNMKCHNVDTERAGNNIPLENLINKEEMVSGMEAMSRRMYYEDVVFFYNMMKRFVEKKLRK